MALRLTQIKQNLSRCILPFTDKRYYKKPLTAFAVLLLVYLGYFTFLSYKCYKVINSDSIEYKVYYNKDFPEHVTVHGQFKDVRLPVTLELIDIVVDLKMDGTRESICKLKGNDFKILRSSNIQVHQNFKIEQNKRYKLENLKQLITKGLSVKLSCRLRYKFKIFTFPFKVTQVIKQPAEEQEQIKVVQHQLLDDCLLSKIKLKLPNFQISMDNLSFDVSLNKKVIGNFDVRVLNKKANEQYLELHSTFAFDKSNIQNMNTGLIESLDMNKFSLEFANLKNEGFVENLLFNIFRHNEIHSNNEPHAIKLSKDRPAMDLKIDRMEGKTIFAKFAIHSSLIDNFIPSYMFLNKINIPDLNLEIKSYRNREKNKRKSLAHVKGVYTKSQISVKGANEKCSDYLVFDIEMIVNDLGLFIQGALNQDSTLEITINEDNIIGKVCRSVAFLWNYYDNFDITSKREIRSGTIVERYPVFDNVNQFSIDTTIDHDDFGTLIIENDIQLPEYMCDNEVFRFGWNKFFYELDFGDFQVDGYVDGTELYFHRIFDHISDILKGDKLKIFSEITKIENKWSKFDVNKNNVTNEIKIPIEIGLVLMQESGLNANDCIKADIKTEIIGTSKKKPTLTRLLEKINIQLQQIKSTQEVEVSIRATPISKDAEIYNIDFNLSIPKMNILLKEYGTTLHFLDINIESLMLSLSYTNNVIYNIKATNRNKLDILVNLLINWNVIGLNFKSFTCVQKQEMDSFSLLINGMLSQTILRPPTCSDVKLLKRPLEESQMTDNNLEVEIDFLVTKDAIRANIEFKLPQNSIFYNKVNKGTRIEWKKCKIDLKDQKNNSSNLIIHAGDLSLQTVEPDEVYQECANFKATIYHDIEFNSNGIQATYTRENDSQRKTISVEKLNDFVKFMKKRFECSKNNDSNLNILSVIEENRSVWIDNGNFYMKNQMCIISPKLGELIGSSGDVIRLLNLKLYPKEACFVIKGKYKIQKLLLDIEINIRSKNNISINYTGNSTDSFNIESKVCIKTNGEEELENLPFYHRYYRYATTGIPKYLSCLYVLAMKELEYTLPIPFGFEFLKSEDYIVFRQKDKEIGRLCFNNIKYDKNTTTLVITNLSLASYNVNGEICLIYVRDKKEMLMLRYGQFDLILMLKTFGIQATNSLLSTTTKVVKSVYNYAMNKFQ